MKKPLALLSALLLTACVSAPPTTPQASKLAPDSSGPVGPGRAAIPRRMVEGVPRSAGGPAGGADNGRQSHLAGRARPHPRGPGRTVGGARRRPAAGEFGRPGPARAASARITSSRRLMAAPGNGSARSKPISPGTWISGASRPRSSSAPATMPKPRRWMRRRRGWRCRAHSPRPISICCSPIRMATSPTRRWPSATGFSNSPRAASMPGWRMPARWNRPRRCLRWRGRMKSALWPSATWTCMPSPR